MVDIPLVSVVIPTRRRPVFVSRALASAFGQTYPNLEVVVIVDGPDEETELYLAGIDDHRLR